MNLEELQKNVQYAVITDGIYDEGLYAEEGRKKLGASWEEIACHSYCRSTPIKILKDMGYKNIKLVQYKDETPTFFNNSGISKPISKEQYEFALKIFEELMKSLK